MDHDALKLGGVISPLILEYLRPEEHYILSRQIPHPAWRSDCSLSDVQLFIFEFDWVTPVVMDSSIWALQSMIQNSHKHHLFEKLERIDWAIMHECKDCIMACAAVSQIPGHMIYRTIKFKLTQLSNDILDRIDLYRQDVYATVHYILIYDLSLIPRIVKMVNIDHNYVDHIYANLGNPTVLNELFKYIDINLNLKYAIERAALYPQYDAVCLALSRGHASGSALALGC